MSMREPLKKGFLLKLETSNNEKTYKREEYVIDKCIGMGAGTVVYDAHTVDEYGIKERVCRLKECYPSDCAAGRNEAGCIIWKDDKSRKGAYERFEYVFKRQLKLQSMSELINSSSHIIERMYKGNNTLYMELDSNNADTFAYGNYDSLYELLKTINALTEAIGMYHKMGFLHLDIKPDNFTVNSDRKDVVSIIDFDSITALNDIKNCNYSSVSYTEQWAAPEVKQHILNDIGEWSDVYSAGAVLFYGLTGRSPEAKDRIDRYRNIDSRLLDGVSYNVRVLVEEILAKTLAAIPKKRYQSMSEFAANLGKAVRLSAPDAVYIQNNMPVQSINYRGRERELAQIEDALRNDRIVIINSAGGTGGMGKSEMAKRYAVKHREDYSTIVFAECSNGIADMIKEQKSLIISNYELDSDAQDGGTGEFIAKFKSLADNDVLIILDDVRDIYESELIQLLEADCKFIITSRKQASDWKGCVHIVLQSMPYEDLYSIFNDNCERHIDKNEIKALPDLFAAYGNMTIFVTMISKIAARGKNINDMLKNIEKNGHMLKDDGRVRMVKDNKYSEDDVNSLMERIFDVGEITEAEREMLGIISLAGSNGISRRLFDNCGVDNIELDNLIETGIVIYSDELNAIAIHDVVADYIHNNSAGVKIGDNALLVKAFIKAGQDELGIYTDSVMWKNIRKYCLSGQYAKDNLIALLPMLENNMISDCIHDEILFSKENYDYIFEIIKSNTYDRKTTFLIVLELLRAFINSAYIYDHSEEADSIVAELFRISMQYCDDIVDYDENATGYTDNPYEGIYLWFNNGFDDETDGEYNRYHSELEQYFNSIPQTIKAIKDNISYSLMRMDCDIMSLMSYTKFAQAVHDDKLMTACEKYIEGIMNTGDNFTCIDDNIMSDYFNDNTLPEVCGYKQHTVCIDIDKCYNYIKDIKNIDDLSKAIEKMFRSEDVTRNEICELLQHIKFSVKEAEIIKNIFFIRLAQEKMFGDIDIYSLIKSEIVLICEYVMLNQMDDVIKHIDTLESYIDTAYHNNTDDDFKYMTFMAMPECQEKLKELDEWLYNNKYVYAARKIAGIRSADVFPREYISVVDENSVLEETEKRIEKEKSQDQPEYDVDKLMRINYLASNYKDKSEQNTTAVSVEVNLNDKDMVKYSVNIYQPQNIEDASLPFM